MIILAVVAFIDAFFIKEIGFNMIIIPSIVIIIIIALFLFNYYLFFQVKIEKIVFTIKQLHLTDDTTNIVKLQTVERSNEL